MLTPEVQGLAVIMARAKIHAKGKTTYTKELDTKGPS